MGKLRRNVHAWMLVKFWIVDTAKGIKDQPTVSLI